MIMSQTRTRHDAITFSWSLCWLPGNLKVTTILQDDIVISEDGWTQSPLDRAMQANCGFILNEEI